MSVFQVSTPTRQYYPGSLPISQTEVSCSDPFYYARIRTERNQVFREAIYGDSEKRLNVNTDRLRHRPNDIIDHMNRPKPLSTMNIN